MRLVANQHRTVITTIAVLFSLHANPGLLLGVLGTAGDLLESLVKRSGLLSVRVVLVRRSWWAGLNFLSFSPETSKERTWTHSFLVVIALPHSLTHTYTHTLPPPPPRLSVPPATAVRTCTYAKPLAAGWGGLMDRVDGLLLCFPGLYYYLYYTGLVHDGTFSKIEVQRT